MTLRRIAILTTVCLSALMFAACSSTDNGPGGVIGEGVPTLSFVGPDVRMVEEGQELTLDLLYAWSGNGVPIPNSEISVSLSGTVAGATLSAFTLQTDEAGTAKVAVRTGQVAIFDVVANTDMSQDVVRVQVARVRFGGLDYMVTYSGTRVISTVEVGLFTNTTCSNLSISVPFATEVQRPSLGVRNTFENVEVGVAHAVYALGIDAFDGVTTEGCADVLLTSPTGNVTIDLVDVTDIYGGRYVIQETLNVTEGFSSGLDVMLDIFGALGSDNPGSFIIDWVLDSDEVDDEIKVAIAIFGPTFLEPFINEVVGSIDFPEPLDDIIDLGADINTAFSNMIITGKLTVPEPTASEFGVTGTHRIESISIPVDGTEVERALFAEASVQAQLSDTITLEEHSFEISFGELFELVLNDVLLPRLPGAPRSIGELLANAFDCDAATDPLARTVCTLGTALIGEQLEEQLAEYWDYDTLILSGTGDLLDTNSDFIKDRFEGDAQARWTGMSTSELVFDGDLEGWRDDGQSRDRHPVRERMRGIGGPN